MAHVAAAAAAMDVGLVPRGCSGLSAGRAGPASGGSAAPGVSREVAIRDANWASASQLGVCRCQFRIGAEHAAHVAGGGRGQAQVGREFYGCHARSGRGFLRLGRTGGPLQRDRHRLLGGVDPRRAVVADHPAAPRSIDPQDPRHLGGWRLAPTVDADASDGLALGVQRSRWLEAVHARIVPRRGRCAQP